MMKFTVELSLHDRIFKRRYTTTGLEELHIILKQEFPKAKILSIFGGPV